MKNLSLLQPPPQDLKQSTTSRIDATESLLPSPVKQSKNGFNNNGTFEVIKAAAAAATQKQVEDGMKIPEVVSANHDPACEHSYAMTFVEDEQDSEMTDDAITNEDSLAIDENSVHENSDENDCEEEMSDNNDAEVNEEKIGQLTSQMTEEPYCIIAQDIVEPLVEPDHDKVVDSQIVENINFGSEQESEATEISKEESKAESNIDDSIQGRKLNLRQTTKRANRVVGGLKDKSKQASLADDMTPCTVRLLQLDSVTISKWTQRDISLPSVSVPQKKMTARKSTNPAPVAKKLRLDSSHQTIDLSNDSDEGFKGWDRSLIQDQNDITIIPYDCNIPKPLTNDCKLWIYKSVGNIAYAKSRRGFIFKCLILGCRFKSLIRSRLLEHLEAKHQGQNWNGFCNICVDVVQSGDASILDEYNHMNNVHVNLHDEAYVEPPVILVPPPSKPLDTSIMKSFPFNPTKSSTPAQPKKSLQESLNIKLPSSITLKKTVAPSTSKLSPVSKVAPVKLDVAPIKLQNEDDPGLLRPWLKSGVKNTKTNEFVVQMQTKESLCAFYKCMSSTCSFFTSDEKLFAKHLSFHEKLTSSDKANFLMCSYCDFVGTNCENTLNHVKLEHIYDRYQCNYCFYRSCANFYVLTHQDIFHKAASKAIIECSDIKPRNARAELNLINELRKKNVPPLICVFCRGKFFVKQLFLDHLEKCEKSSEVKCIECGETCTKSTIHKHLGKCHGLGLFHCVYCEFGSDLFEVLNTHIINEHPSKTPVFCERTDHLNPDGTLKCVRKSEITYVSILNLYFYYRSRHLISSRRASRTSNRQ